MSRKKRPQKVTQAIPVGGPLPVMHGDAFRTFIEEATSIGNELTARRQFCSEVVEYLKQKALIEEWEAWYNARREAAKKA